MKEFIFPGIITTVLLIGIFLYGGIAAVYIAILLIILEVTLSFDNAVVNARILVHMDEKWQQRFLTWGIFVAVFGTRFLLPILIVSASLLIDPWTITKLALFDPVEYGHLIHTARYAIGGFGATFLLMVSLKFFFDSAKEHHWFDSLESVLSKWGKIESLEIGVSLLALLGISLLVPTSASATLLFAGILGIAVFILMQGVANYFSSQYENVAGKGLALFMYLEVIDMAFSLDSVVGAFALTSSLPIILVGLAIGAYYVRTLTIHFVKHKTLDRLVFLEHGAHYAIFALAVSMFVSMIMHVPEVITGTIGVVFVAFAYWSSLTFNRNNKETGKIQL